MINVYLAYPTNRYDEAKEILMFLNSNLSDISKITFVIPEERNLKFKNIIPKVDLSLVLKSDLLLVFMPEPSIGASIEMSYFKIHKQLNPIIGYKCLDHPFLDYFLDTNYDNLDDVLDYIRVFEFNLRD